jgi:hypothetical protein
MLSLAELRKHLGPMAKLSDQQLGELREQLYVLAEVVMDQFLDATREAPKLARGDEPVGVDRQHNTAISSLHESSEAQSGEQPHWYDRDDDRPASRGTPPPVHRGD